MSKPESELSACVRRLVTDYFDHLDGEKCSGVHDMVIGSVEKPLLEVVLNHTEGNQTRASEILGINRNTLRKKMQHYGVK
jgi:Fis family transcriptional regulator